MSYFLLLSDPRFLVESTLFHHKHDASYRSLVRTSENSSSPHFVNKEGKDPKVALVYQGEPVAVTVAVPGVVAAWARGLPPGLVLGTRSWSIPHSSSERSVE
jgi:hypothetical protein